MIIKLNSNSTATVVPQEVPENLNNIYISYVFPKGLNHLRPVLVWGGETYEGNNIYIKKTNLSFDFKVTLYDGEEVYKVYKSEATPHLFIAYNINRLEPNLINYIKELEQENKELKERGDIVWLN